jgi:hypothetical protein
VEVARERKKKKKKKKKKKEAVVHSSAGLTEIYRLLLGTVTKGQGADWDGSLAEREPCFGELSSGDID